MSGGTTETDADEVPWIQELYDNIWLIGLAALLFFFVAYLGWGLYDIFTTPGGPAP